MDENEHAASKSWDVFYSRLGFLLRRCHQASISIFIEKCAAYDLTPTQYGILSCVQLNPDIDQIGIARAIGLDRSTTGSVVKRLVTRGLIQRVVNTKDRRKRALKLTEAGLTLVAEAEPATDRAQEEMLQGLSAEETTLLFGLLTRLMETTAAHNRVAVDKPPFKEDAPVAP